MYIRVHVTPGARREKILKSGETEYRIAVREKAERNMANTRVRTIISEILHVPLAKVTLLTGHRSSTKILSIDT
jgi:uncharacterized protein YggU (UPF0235/DUF167 family)